MLLLATAYMLLPQHHLHSLRDLAGNFRFTDSAVARLEAVEVWISFCGMASTMQAAKVGKNGFVLAVASAIQHMSICQNLRVGEYIRMGHEQLKPCKAMGHIEKRHPKLIGGPSKTPLCLVKEDPTSMNVITIWPLVK